MGKSRVAIGCNERSNEDVCGAKAVAREIRLRMKAATWTSSMVSDVAPQTEILLRKVLKECR